MHYTTQEKPPVFDVPDLFLNESIWIHSELDQRRMVRILSATRGSGAWDDTSEIEATWAETERTAFTCDYETAIIKWLLIVNFFLEGSFFRVWLQCYQSIRHTINF